MGGQRGFGTQGSAEVDLGVVCMCLPRVVTEWMDVSGAKRQPWHEGSR